MNRRSSRARLAAPLLSFLVLQTGCGASSASQAKLASSPAVAPGLASTEMAMPAQPAADAAPVSAPPPAPPPPSSTPARAQPLAAPSPQGAKSTESRTAKSAGPSVRAAVIIYEGDVKMSAEEEAVPKTIDKIIDIAEALGGNLASRKDASVTVKVPSPSFREAMTKIDGLGGVTGRAVKADDVSEEFHDLEVRLTNLRATRARLQEFLAKAGDIPNMLTVERELERVAQEIDRIEGRLSFLRSRAAMSVIAVTITTKPKDRPVVAPAVVAPTTAATPELPVPWVSQVGIDRLLSLGGKK